MAQNLIKQTNQKSNSATLTAKACSVTKLRSHPDLEIKEKHSVARKGATGFL